MSKKNKNRGNNMSDPISSEPELKAYIPNINKDVERVETDVVVNPEPVVTETENIPKQEEPAMPEPTKKETKVEKKVVASTTTAAQPQRTNVDKIVTLARKFDEAFNAHEETIGPLISICNYLNSTNDPKAFQMFTRWFSAHQNDSMSDEVALRGIHTIQNKKTKTRVEATHQCFVELIRVLKMKPRGHYRFTIKAMRAMEISERLAQWIHQKAAGQV